MKQHFTRNKFLQIKHRAWLPAALALLASCTNNFLDLAPEGQLNEATFYKSTTDFQQALAGAYSPLRGSLDARGNNDPGTGIAIVAYYMDEMRSDNTHYDYNAKDRGGLGYEQLADFMDDQQNAIIGQRYEAAYRGVYRTNVILDRIEQIDFKMEESDRKTIVGETKALRAHYFFDLVRHYGPVPMPLHEIKDNTTAFIGRTGVDSVYTQIISDFTDALEMLAPPDKFPQSGHITKGMVATELALVYMTRKQFDKAVPLLQSVTQMGYSLLDNYADVFDPAKKNNRESVFELQYKAGTTKQENNFIYRFIPVTPNTRNILGIEYNNANGGWNVPSDDIMKAYEPGDKRLDASVGIVEGYLDGNGDFMPEKVVSVVGYAGPPAGKTYRRFIKKYWHPPYDLVNNAGDNWPMFRYADVLLMLAESLNETGRSGEALPHLNAVRRRAGLPEVNVTDQAQLRNIIAHERRIELAFENHRWLDLVRTGQAIPVMTAYGKYMKANYGYLLPNSYNVTEERLIYPIPFRDLQINPLLTQNKGY